MTDVFLREGLDERSAAQGFTLTELMVTLSILAIFLTIAMPSFQTVTSANRVSSEISDLRSDIEFARTQAQTMGLPVIVCPSAGGANCDGTTSWAKGWIVAFANPDCGAPAATPLRIRAAFLSTDVAEFFPVTPAAPFVCFNRLGYASQGMTGNFKFDAAVGSSVARCIAMSSIGHLQLLTKGKIDSVTGVVCS